MRSQTAELMYEYVPGDFEKTAKTKEAIGVVEAWIKRTFGGL